MLDADYEAIRVERSGDGVITVVIDRPEARNALNSTVRTELADVMPAIEESDARVAVLTGSSDCNAFVAGADVSELQERGMLEQRRASQRPRIYETIAELQTPVVARINGHALGGGLELKPWEATSNRGVYSHFHGRWVPPRRLVRYDGAPEDLVVAVLIGVPSAQAFGPPIQRVVGAALLVSAGYVGVRKRLPALSSWLSQRVPESLRRHVPERFVP